MKIMDFISKDAIKVGLESTTKREVIGELVDLLIKARKVRKDAKGKVVRVLMEREKAGSTGIGQGIAIPHARSTSVKDVVIAFGSSPGGIEFSALDGEPVYIIFLLMAPKESTGLHLKILAKISRLLKDKYFRMDLKDAKIPEKVIRIIKKEDQ